MISRTLESGGPRPTITDAEIVDMVIRHANKQRQKAVDSLDRCSYRADYTPECPIRCFAGIFIDDSKYNKYLEHRTFNDICLKSNNVLLFDFTINQLRLIDELQKIHDFGVESWAREIRDIIKYMNGVTAEKELEKLEDWINFKRSEW